MKVTERSYSSKVFRPKPHVHAEADGTLLVIATSWGLPEHAQLAVDEIVKYVTAARGDVEVTSPFEFMTCYSDLANHLRIGMLIANETLYRGQNKSEYVSGVEVLAISKRGHQISWAQVGAPHLLLQREHRPLAPLAVSFDNSFEIGLRGETVAPLPSRLLGVDPSCAIVCGDVHVQDEDQLVLLSSSVLPTSLWTNPGKLQLGSVSNQMVAESSENPFWLGLVEFGD